jgi:hypothetical protein
MRFPTPWCRAASLSEQALQVSQDSRLLTVQLLALLWCRRGTGPLGDGGYDLAALLGLELETVEHLLDVFPEISLFIHYGKTVSLLGSPPMRFPG